MRHSWLESRACLAECESTHGLDGAPRIGRSVGLLSPSVLLVLDCESKPSVCVQSRFDDVVKNA
jgi:hypothetical protein